MQRVVTVSCAAIILLSMGCEREKEVDVFTGPAVRAAKQAARNVSPGTVELTAFSAYDIGDLIGIEGRSFIAKLPADAPPNTRDLRRLQRPHRRHASCSLNFRKNRPEQ